MNKSFQFTGCAKRKLKQGRHSQAWSGRHLSEEVELGLRLEELSLQQRKLSYPPLTTGSRTENLVKDQPVPLYKPVGSGPGPTRTSHSQAHSLAKRSRTEGMGESWAVLP